MTARIITVANQKGGSGKSTIAMSMAGTMAYMGHKTLVVDADPQGTATQWAGSSPEKMPFPATVVGMAHARGKLHQMVKPMVKDYDYIVIDCPPSVEEQASQSALLISDVCLVPLQPTPPDLWASVGIFELVNKARTVNSDLKAYAFANRVSTTNLSQQVLGILSENDIELLVSKFGSRNSFQEAPVRGSVPCAMGFAHKPAAAEVKSLLVEVFEKMGWKLLSITPA